MKGKETKQINNDRFLGDKISHFAHCRFHCKDNGKKLKKNKLRRDKIYFIFKENLGRMGRGKKIWKITWKLTASVKRQMIFT